MANLILRKPVEDLSAGFPSAAEGYEDEPLNLHEWIVRNPAATFFYRVQGDDLQDEHIRDGSVLVVDRSVTPKHGRLVLAEEAGRFVVRRHQPAEQAMVCGVIVAVVTRL